MGSSKKKHDPLAGSKVPALDPHAPTDPAPPEELEPEAELADEEDFEPPPAPEPSPPPKRYKVTNDIVISWGIQMVRLKPGSIVSDLSHGAGAVERMRNAGAQLEEMD